MLSSIPETMLIKTGEATSSLTIANSRSTRSKPNSSQIASISWKRGRVKAAMIMTESLAWEFDQTNPGNFFQKMSRRSLLIP